VIAAFLVSLVEFGSRYSKWRAMRRGPDGPQPPFVRLVKAAWTALELVAADEVGAPDEALVGL
jgi:hypothetical protein